tara:strand:+ start:73 stop:369 length:297 start_codon:yes stop_codon:yes gene_type:complete
MATATQDKTYNGWTNYETWNAKLWLDNDPSSQEYMEELARQYREPYALSQSIQDNVEEWKPDLEPSMFSDMLNASLSEVNWYEIAESYLEDLEDEDEE